MTSGTLWTQAETDFLIQNKGVLSYSQIGEKIGRSAKSCKEHYYQVTGQIVELSYPVFKGRACTWYKSCDDCKLIKCRARPGGMSYAS